MPIHFAASRRLPRSSLARHLTAPRSMQAVNDNYDGVASPLVDNPLMRATLEHFAAHGLAAAADARTRAECAFLGEDAESYRHWAAVCRLLDRRMASGLARGHQDDLIH